MRSRSLPFFYCTAVAVIRSPGNISSGVKVTFENFGETDLYSSPSSEHETEKVLANASKATANRLIVFFIFYMVFNWLTKFVKKAFIHTKQLQKNNFGAEN